ncbi:hypothetical protein P3X46_002262 [Hevea brasiliensis]|uniref:DUF4220 domain-containing protein n=2 Tax=Hevea brasiliensis TaxID=3981 RepID=A0ABQ9N3H2_HEVBR|nr:hypothetical protein P3X46_002262 [Hevea brasiliensis]
MGDVYENKDKGRIVLDPDTQITSFWAPFLLLHLGGPDTITAYSLEDNELWLRHFLGLGVQTGVALYIFLLAWIGSRFSILTMPMFLAGIIKYGERTWALRSASNDELRDSMLTDPDPGPNYSKFMEEFTLKQYEGFHVQAQEVIETQIQVEVSVGDDTIEGETELLKASYLFKTFKRLFVDLILSFQDRDNSQSLFKGTSYKDAFKVIEIELGFMYDMLYTKGTIIYSRKGCCLRFISLTSTCIVLVFFSLSNKGDFKKIDIAITFLLLVIAIFLELSAVLFLVSSDWADLYLSKHKTVIRQAITHIQLQKGARWSNSLGQYSLLSYSLKSMPVFNSKIQKFFGIVKILEHRQMTNKDVSDEQKEFIFDHLKKKFDDLMEIKSTDEPNYQKELKDLSTCRGARALSDFPALRWSVETEFDQSILIWHIATHLCAYSQRQNEQNIVKLENEDDSKKFKKISKLLSRYMLYLLVMRPSMLPMGIGKIRYLDTCAEAKKFFQEHDCAPGDDIHLLQNTCSWAMNLFKGAKYKEHEKKACNALLKVNTAVPPLKVKGDRSKSVLFDACNLASLLQNENIKNKWKVMSNVWVEMLAYAASHCRGIYHAQQLGRGGELLTHIWLLMAHFGLTEQFQISLGHARAKLFVE